MLSCNAAYQPSCCSETINTCLSFALSAALCVMTGTLQAKGGYTSAQILGQNVAKVDKTRNDFIKGAKRNGSNAEPQGLPLCYLKEVWLSHISLCHCQLQAFKSHDANPLPTPKIQIGLKIMQLRCLCVFSFLSL